MVSNTEFLWKVHGYTNEYIRFADTKAAVVIAWSGALLGALYSAKSFNLFLDGKLLDQGSALTAWISALAHLGLGIGFLLAVWVVIPRLGRGNQPADPNELIYWGSIRAFPSAAGYLDAITACNNEARCIANHIYVLGKIATQKYWWLGACIWSTALGTFLAIIVLFAI